MAIPNAKPTLPFGLHDQNREMTSRASSSSSGTGSGSGTSQFTFVTGNIQSEARSHAMREHWKTRHKRNQEAKTSNRKKASSSRTLLPRRTSVSNEEEGSNTAATASTSPSGLQHHGEVVGKKHSQPGIPAQMFCGMSYALSSARPDPFQTCPVHLTSQHQKLLHHCAC